MRDTKIPDLVSKAEAADILKVKHQAVQQMTDSGRLIGAKVGNAWVYRRVVVEALALARKADKADAAAAAS